MTRIILSSLLLLSLVGCGNEPSGKTTTKLDAVEVQPGTVSDSMIILDNAASDGTAIDNSVPDDGTKKKDAAKPDANAATESDDGASTDPDAVEAPIAKKAVTTDDAAKNSE